MRINCPICGMRDMREFTYKGAALDRPAAEAGPEPWDDYVHLRENPAGPAHELWYHGAGCTAWIEVTRDTRTHAMIKSKLVGGAS